MDKRWESFLQALVREAHGESLPQPLAAKMVADLSVQLHSQLHELMFSLLPNEADQLQYENLIMSDRANAAALEDFLQPRIPQLEQRIEECLKTFHSDYLRICGTN